MKPVLALDALKTALHNQNYYMNDEVERLAELEKDLRQKKNVIIVYQASIEDIQKAIKIMEAVQ